MSEPQHRWPVRVYYEDTDAGGVVYHARFLCFCERARTEFLRALGIDHHRLAAAHGVVFTVRRLTLDLDAPARLDDALDVVTRLLGVGGARLHVQQEVRRDAARLATARLELAVVGSDLRPRRLPAELVAQLSGWLPRAAVVSDLDTTAKAAFQAGVRRSGAI